MENSYQIQNFYSGTHAKKFKNRKLIVFQIIFILLFIGSYFLPDFLKSRYPDLVNAPITDHPWLVIIPFIIVIGFMIIFHFKRKSLPPVTIQIFDNYIRLDDGQNSEQVDKNDIQKIYVTASENKHPKHTNSTVTKFISEQGNIMLKYICDIDLQVKLNEELHSKGYPIDKI